jgi:hypothetical protein
MQLGRNTGALQGQVRDRAMLRVGASVAFLVVGGMGQKDGRCIGRDAEIRPDFILVFGLQIARIAQDSEIGPATDFVDGIDWFIRPLIETGGGR